MSCPSSIPGKEVALLAIKRQTAVGNLVEEWGYLDVGDEAAPAFADLDGDGDLDAYVGNKDGGIVMYVNTGSATEPSFAQDTTVNNPFSDLSSYHSEGFDSPTPIFVDLDADGDMDMPMGFLNGPLTYFENNGDEYF